MKVEKVPIASLVLDPANVRKHGQKNMEAIKGSLARFGQQKPVVVNADNVVIAGNGTLAAARELGWSEIAVVRTTLTGSDLTAYGIADNRSSELAEWDQGPLAQQLSALEVAGFDIASIGFTPEDVGRFTVGEVAPPEMKDGDRAPFRQATFTLHDDQWAEVEAALASAKDEGGGESDVNENSNGNALAFICARFNNG